MPGALRDNSVGRVPGCYPGCAGSNPALAAHFLRTLRAQRHLVHRSAQCSRTSRDGGVNGQHVGLQSRRSGFESSSSRKQDLGPPNSMFRRQPNSVSEAEPSDAFVTQGTECLASNQVVGSSNLSEGSPCMGSRSTFGEAELGKRGEAERPVPLMLLWRNWNTQRSQKPWPQGIWVRLPGEVLTLILGASMFGEAELG